jgi:hypothetical protein
MQRLKMALAVAPLWGAPFGALCGGGAGIPTPGPWLLVGAIFGAVCAYLAALLFGLPAFLFLSAKGWARWWVSILFGAMAGLCAGAVFPIVIEVSMCGYDCLSMPQPPDAWVGKAGFAGVSALVGSLIGITFWGIIRPSATRA